jgi:hypothetical protein
VRSGEAAAGRVCVPHRDLWIDVFDDAAPPLSARTGWRFERLQNNGFYVEGESRLRVWHRGAQSALQRAPPKFY